MHNTSDFRASLLDKPRGANRSTKVAGKLKLLPEQPERLPVLSKSPSQSGSPRPSDDAVSSTGESEDGDVESSEDNERNEADSEVPTGYDCS